MVKIIKSSDLSGIKEAYQIHTTSFYPKSADFLEFKGFKDLCELTNAQLLTAQSPKIGLIGYILFRNLGEEAELLSLAVAKTHQKQGYGKKLIEEMILTLKNPGCKAIFLEVGEKNQAARALYRSLGAKLVNTRKAYYTNPNGTKEDALIKKIPLC